MSGNATITSGGNLQIGADAITASDIADINSTTITSGNLLIQDGNAFDSKVVTGDVTISGLGVTDVTFINSMTATTGRI